MIDKVSGPARGAMGALKEVAKTAKAMGRESIFGAQQRNALGQFGTRAGGLIGVFKKIDKGISATASAAMKLGAAGAIVAGATGYVAMQATEMLVDSLTFQQSTKAAFGAIEGSSEAGARLYDHILGMSKHFRQSPKDMMKSVLALRAAGLSTNEALSVLQSGMDLKTLTPDANLEALSRAIGQIKGKGKLEAEELNQLAESGGLAKDAVYKALLAIKGLSATDPTSMDKLQAMMRAGKVSANEAIPAIQKAIATMTGVERAGEYADKARNSVGALINGLKAAPEQFLLRMSVDDGPLVKLLKMLNDLFDPDTESGKRMMDMINRIGKAMMDIFGKMGTPENMVRTEKLIINLLKLMPILIGVFATALDIFITVFDALMNVGDNFAYCWKESDLFKGAMIALGVVLSPLLVVIAAIALAVGLLALPFIAAGAAIYGAWLILKKFIDGIGSAISKLATLLGLKEKLEVAKTGFGDVATGAAAIAPPTAATPLPKTGFMSSKTANIVIEKVDVKNVSGDTPANQAIGNEAGAAINRQVVLALRQAGSELG